MDKNVLESRFTYHPPKDDQPKKYKFLREFALHFAFLINKNCPESREKEIALVRLEESIMWANSSIARNE